MTNHTTPEPEANVTADAQVAAMMRFMEQQVPFNLMLGMRVEQLAGGTCVLRVPWRAELTGDPFRPAVHGGVLAALADATGGAACFASLGDVEARLSTVDMRIDYLQASHGEDLVCLATVVRIGNRVAVARMELFAGALPNPDAADERQPIATAQAVYNVSRPPAN